MARFHFRCTECGATYREDEVRLVCTRCSVRQEAGGPVRGVLDVVIEDLPSSWPSAGPATPAFLGAFLPVDVSAPLPPLPVGGTPLLPSPALRAATGMPRLWVKDDTRNPSGSTKDRASFLVVAKAMEYGHVAVATASTGNAATALAAVAAASGIRAVVFVPATVPDAKLAQMLAYGAEVIPVDGSYDEAFELCQVACEAFGWYNRNTALNPFTVEGKKTAALEIAAQLAPEMPDVVLVPTGDGVILSGLAKGFADLVLAGLARRMPRLIAVQPAGTSAIVDALLSGAPTIRPVKDAHSVADSLVVQAPRNAIQCLRRIRESAGGGVKVSEEEILRSIGKLGRLTGIFAEPAAAAALAGLDVAVRDGLVDPGERIVLLVTGSGLKDIPSAMRSLIRPAPIRPTLDGVADRLRA